MWKQGVVNGYFWQAKVYYESSSFGIEGGRISKLVICSTEYWDHDKVVYNYDRGLDINKISKDILNLAIDEASK